jgi:hypothetical protein
MEGKGRLQIKPEVRIFVGMNDASEFPDAPDRGRATSHMHEHQQAPYIWTPRAVFTSSNSASRSMIRNVICLRIFCTAQIGNGGEGKKGISFSTKSRSCRLAFVHLTRPPLLKATAPRLSFYRVQKVVVRFHSLICRDGRRRCCSIMVD